MNLIDIAELKVLHLRASISTPRINAFGEQRWREAVLVRLRDESGLTGWGEVFSNWPPGGARYRSELLRSVFAPLIVGNAIGEPQELAIGLGERTRLLALQCGDLGAFAQCLAGIDVAAWDLWCARRGVPMAAAVGGGAVPDSIALYASGIGPNWLERGSQIVRELGIDALKVKIGFGIDSDGETLRRVRELIGSEATLMVDANQRWSVDEALEALPYLEDFALSWIEEPLPSDSGEDEWKRVAAAAPAQLAAGENVVGLERFRALLQAQVLGVIQPDLIKWGGVSGLAAVAAEASLNGVEFVPHYLGAGVGLFATAHLLAAFNSTAPLEFDISENPLQRATVATFPRVEGGRMELPAGPGHGAVVDPRALERAGLVVSWS